MKRPSSGIPVGNERRRPVQDIDGEEVDLNDLDAVQKVKIVYGHERTRWESLRAGKYVSYTFPKAYNGRSARCVDGDPDAVVEKARKSEWVELEKWLRANQIKQVKAFMACVFDTVPVLDGRMRPARAPEPNQIRTEKSLLIWREHKDKLYDSVRVQLMLERNMASSEFYLQRINSTPEDAWAIILLNGRMELSPLFRYCIAMGLAMPRFDKIASRYYADAIMQFERYRLAYKQHWGKLLPAGFSAESQRLYPHLLVA